MNDASIFHKSTFDVVQEVRCRYNGPYQNQLGIVFGPFVHYAAAIWPKLQNWKLSFEWDVEKFGLEFHQRFFSLILAACPWSNRPLWFCRLESLSCWVAYHINGAVDRVLRRCFTRIILLSHLWLNMGTNMLFLLLGVLTDYIDKDEKFIWP